MNDDSIQPPAPVTPASASGAIANDRTATLARVGLLGIAAAAFIAVAMLAFGSSLSPARTLAGSESSGTTEGSNETLELFGGGPGFGRGFGHLFGGITITAISGNDLSLETADGWTRTITVDDGTEYSRSGDEIGLADLAVGDRIGFGQTLEDDGTWTIDAIVVVLPHVGGEVTAIDGSTITVERRDGETSTITVTGDTEYQVDGDEATLADVEVGMLLIAQGTENADGTLTATEVKAAEMDVFEGRPGFGGPGGPGGPRGFGWGFGHGFDRPGDESPDATDEPADATAS